MKLAFATLGCPNWDLATIVRQAKTMGFDGVELRGIAGEHIGPDETPAARAAIRRQFAEAGVGIAALMGYSKFTWDDPVKRQGDVTVAEKYIAVARDIGCPIVRLFGGMHTDVGWEETLRRVSACVKPLADRAEQAGVTLAVETHDDWCKGECLRALLDAVPSPALAVCWDLCNAHFVEPMERTFQAIKHRIVHVHFKDAGRSAEGKVVSKLPGTGEVNMRRALELLKSIGYRGYLSFEWEKKWEPDLAEPEVAFPHYLKHATDLMAQTGVARG